MRRISMYPVAACLLLLAGVAGAAPAVEPVQVSLQVFKVTVADGKEALVASKSAKPGETLEYRAVYANVSKKKISKLAASLPVPAGMEYIAQTARPMDAQASTDGREFAPVPLMRKSADGKTLNPVPVADYRALRWSVATLQPGQNFEVSARMRVRSQ